MVREDQNCDIWLNVMIKLQKAMILLNKDEHCMLQSPVLHCFVYCHYREKIMYIFNKCISRLLFLFRPM